MGARTEFTAEKLVIGVLTGGPDLGPRLFAALEERWGPIDCRSATIDFSFSRYYDAEMGSPLFRRFVSFQNLVSPDSLWKIKTDTNAMEADFAVDGKRRVNLDPGIMALSRFILASTKNSSHRIPLAGGMYAEIELVYERKSFRPVEWTYPDYRSTAYLEIFNKIREIYKTQLQLK